MIVTKYDVMQLLYACNIIILLTNDFTAQVDKQSDFFNLFILF